MGRKSDCRIDRVGAAAASSTMTTISSLSLELLVSNIRLLKWILLVRFGLPGVLGNILVFAFCFACLSSRVFINSAIACPSSTRA